MNSEWHPKNVELARLSGECPDDGIWEHVSSCPRCRRLVVDYDWLGEGLASALKSVGDRVPVPQSGWRKVQDRVLAGRYRQLIRVQASAMVSAALVVSLLLCAPGFLRPAVAALVARPEASLRPTPKVVAVPTGAGNGSLLSGRSARLAEQWSSSLVSPAPVLAPVPAPPDLGP